MASNNENSWFNIATRVGERVGQLEAETSHLRSAAYHAIEDAVSKAKSLTERGRNTTNELVEQALDRVKGDPLRSVAICFAAGCFAGAMAGWLTARKVKEKQHAGF